MKCEKRFGGCERQFCFLCAAPHIPTVRHGNWYHRPQCSFYNPQCDCEPICVMDNELAVCKMSIYSPGPCQACKEARSGNKCTHSTWRPCGSCQRNSVECTHWCDECARKGSLCTPPGNPKVAGPDGELVYQFKVTLSEAIRYLVILFSHFMYDVLEGIFI